MKYQFDQPTTIILAAASGGDGSYSVHFFIDNEAYQAAEDADPERYGCDGGTSITVTGVFDTGSDWRIIQTLDDVKKYYGLE